MMFTGDLNPVWTSLHNLKSLCFHFMKIVWQFRTDTSCLNPIMEMLVTQLQKDKVRVEILLENGDIKKIVIKAFATLLHFVTLEKNEAAA